MRSFMVPSALSREIKAIFETAPTSPKRSDASCFVRRVPKTLGSPMSLSSSAFALTRSSSTEV